MKKLRTVGIICECNPPHAGHFYLLDRARSSGESCVICVMSGCFVQRGEAAILDPFARAELLVRAGADVVVELPYPYSASSAEFFGLAGVDILDRLGVKELWFGSECGELSSLSRFADIAESDAFRAAYRECGAGTGTARAYLELLSSMSGESVPPSANDILAISYLRAIKRLECEMKAFPVRRIGSGYSETELRFDCFPSATALRKQWIEQGLTQVLEAVPEFTREILVRELENGRAPVRMEQAASLILGTLRLCDRERISDFAGLSGGLAGRLVHAAHNASDLDSLFSLAATKKYPDATVRRALLCALLETPVSALSKPAAYVRLLAANQKGCAHLSAMRKNMRISVVTRQGEIPQTEAAQRQSAMEEREKALYSLMLPKPTTAKTLLCHPPVIVSEK